MIEVSLVEALNDSVNRLQAGQSVADCLALYPQYAAELESLLTVSGVVSWSQPSMAEAAQAEARGQFRFEQAISQPWTQSRTVPLTPLMRWAASIALVVMFLAGGAGLMAESSLPGDALYPVKLFTEDVRLTLQNHDPALEAIFEARRLEEARSLVQLGREAEMTLTGTVQAETSNSVLIDGLLIRTDDPDNLVGNVVEVDVISTSAGELVARAIRRRGEAANEPPATEAATEPPASSATPSPSDTPMPTATRTPAPTRRATITRQPTRQPTSQRPTTDASPDSMAVDQAGNCDTAPSEWVRYTVQSGDTLSDLALRSGETMAAVVEANCIDNARHIVAGQVIFLPRSPARLMSTTTARADQQGTPLHETTMTPGPQRDGEPDSQQSREQQREEESGDSDGGDRSGDSRGR